MELVFATHNPNKLAEIQAMVGDTWTLKSLDDIGFFDEIVEDSQTIEGNASLKAQAIYKRFAINVFSDDTGLEVAALGGLPGVLSARFAGASCSSEDNIDKLLKELEGKPDRSARFKTIVSLIYNGEEKQFEGIIEGEILLERSGSGGFGYDSVFRPKGHTLSFGQMQKTEKNQISHRRRAFEKMVKYLNWHK
jgi:XTP/dITP diphosphohydrolase